MIGAVVAAVLAAGAVTPWTSPSGVESVARVWEPPGGARCQVVFLPGDEDPPATKFPWKFAPSW